MMLRGVTVPVTIFISPPFCDLTNSAPLRVEEPTSTTYNTSLCDRTCLQDQHQENSSQINA